MEHSSQPYARIIVNPVAGSGSTGRKWPHIRELLTQSGFSFDYSHTEDEGHAAELAREAAGLGYEMVVAAGGDGTLNEVVNGLVGSGRADSVTLGILNTGSACDFAHFLGIPRDYNQACMRLLNPRKVPVDVGLVECQSGGQPVHRFFINAASLGLDGEVVETVAKGPKLIRGTIPYVIGLLRSLVKYRNKSVTLCIDDEQGDIRICTVVIANGGFFGGRMNVAPDADVHDGLFEVMIVEDMGKLELLRAFPRVYRGTHVTHPKVRMQRTAKLTVESAERVLVQADGELMGELPATFQVLPSALMVAV